MKKEIIIDGKGSDWFETATFVLKGSQGQKLPKDLFSYAEEIVETHMKKMPQSKTQGPVSKSYLDVLVDDTMQSDSYKRQNQRAKMKKREKQVNMFLVISLVACALSLIALAMSIFS